MMKKDTFVSESTTGSSGVRDSRRAAMRAEGTLRIKSQAKSVCSGSQVVNATSVEEGKEHLVKVRDSLRLHSGGDFAGLVDQKRQCLPNIRVCVRVYTLGRETIGKRSKTLFFLFSDLQLLQLRCVDSEGRADLEGDWIFNIQIKKTLSAAESNKRGTAVRPLPLQSLGLAPLPFPTKANTEGTTTSRQRPVYETLPESGSP